MAEVYLVYRVTPSKSDVNYEELKNEIKKALELSTRWIRLRRRT